MLDFVADDCGVLRWLFRAFQRPPRDGDDLIEIVLERCFCWLSLLLLRFQKQFRLGENPLARLLVSGVAPCTVEQRGLPRRPVLLREDLRHLFALLAVDARHRSQISHGDLRGDAACADLLLHRLWQRVHQRQATCDPTRTAVETACQFLNRVAVPAFHLGHQPALFERGFRFAAVA